jgi:hypothetical protein
MRYSSARSRCNLLITIVGLIGMIGCGEPTAPGAELARARERWVRTAPAAYRLTIQQACFCDLVHGPVEVVVRDGVVQSRRDVATDRLLDAQMADAYPAVEGLFELIDRAITQGAVRVEVTFDPVRGYPRQIILDHRADMADDEVVVTVSEFGAL